MLDWACSTTSKPFTIPYASTRRSDTSHPINTKPNTPRHKRCNPAPAGIRHYWAIALGGGHTWKTVKWEPTVWMFYDWASGDSNPADGTNNTAFQYYGLVHAYLGLIDNLARQNISDINYRVQLKPTKKLQLQAAHHFFQLASGNDSLYTITGQKFGTAGVNGTDIGQELDLLATYTYNQNFSIEMGQFWFWYGDYIANVQPTPQDAQQFYIQTTFRY